MHDVSAYASPEVTCSDGLKLPPTVTTPYESLYYRAGFGQTFTATEPCVEVVNRVPIRSFLPTKIELVLGASGTYSSGQDVFAPEAVYNVWHL